MIRGWLIDHRFLLTLTAIAAAVPFALGVDASMRNPISETLTISRAADIANLLTTSLLVICLRSRTAERLWIDSGAPRRAGWFLTLAAISVLTSSILAPGGAQFRYQFSLLGVVFGMASLLTMLDEERSGLLWLFAIGVSALLTPITPPAPWWTPLYAEEPSLAVVLLGAVALVAACTAYTTNLFGRRRY